MARNQMYSPLEMSDIYKDYPGATKTANPVVITDIEERSRFGDITYKKAIGQVTVRCPLKNEKSTWGQVILSSIALFYGYSAFLVPAGFAVYGTIGYILQTPGHFFFVYGFGLCIALAIMYLKFCKIIIFCALRMIPRRIQQSPLSRVTFLGRRTAPHHGSSDQLRNCSPSASAFQAGQILPRPHQSAGYPHTPGMPSGHVLNTWTLMIWALCELEAEGNPLHFYPWYVIIILLNAPVPWARYYNYDHKLSQVGTSACLSIFFGIGAFLVREAFFPGHKGPWEYFDIPAYHEEALAAGYQNASDKVEEIIGRIGSATATSTKKLFDELDKDGSGKIDKHEWLAGLKAHGDEIVAKVKNANAEHSESSHPIKRMLSMFL